MSSDKVNCPFCDYKGRADHAKRHLKGHKIDDIVDLPLPNGCNFHSIDRKPYVVVCLASEGSAKSVGYCFRCNEVIEHLTGSGRASYASHVCKPPRGGSLPPVTDFLPVVAAPVVAVPVVTSAEINWEAVLKDIVADAEVKALIEIKSNKEESVEEEDDDYEPRVKKEKSTRDIIIDAIKTHAILRRCARLEKLCLVVGTTNDNLERSVKDVTEQLIESERIRQNLNDLVNTAYAEIQKLKSRPTVTFEDTIEHSN